MNSAVGGSRPNSFNNVRGDIAEPKTLFGGFDPEGGLHRVSVGREPFDESAAVVNLIFYQCALIHGSTPFSIAS